jgi:hypothetical protein
MLAIELGELLVHGFDVTRDAGLAWPIEPTAAALALGGGLRVLPLLLDTRRAAGLSMRLKLHIRHGSPRVVLGTGPSGEDAGPSVGSCLIPAGGRMQQYCGVRDELLAFTQHVEIMLFDLGRAGHHLRHVLGCKDIAAGKDVGRARGEVGHQGCR